jgi:hypothetical protein
MLEVSATTGVGQPTGQPPQQGFDPKAFFAALPTCTPHDEFTISPLPFDRFDSIFPLGGVDPSTNRLLPADHFNLAIHREGDPIPVAAPGNITIFQVTETTRFNVDREVTLRDYALYFAPCSQIEASYGHIRTISDSLQTAITAAEKECQPEYPVGDIMALACAYFPNYIATAGEVLGTLVAEDGAPNFDFGALDWRYGPLPFASPGRYQGNAAYVACPLDLFEASLKATLYERLGNGSTQRTVEPRCGTIMLDMPGTLQGYWFTESGDAGELGRSGKSLALIYDNVDPTIGVASLGNAVGMQGRIDFTARHSGPFNREFNEVTPGPAIYCYASDIANDDRALHGKLLVQLVDATTLRVEYRPGECGESETFSTPLTYIR